MELRDFGALDWFEPNDRTRFVAAIRGVPSEKYQHRLVAGIGDLPLEAAERDPLSDFECQGYRFYRLSHERS
jgi:hypothetical protein